MTKPIFDNRKNAHIARGTNGVFINICLWLSTLTSAICCAFFLYSLLGHRSEWFDSIPAYAVYGASSLYFCFYVDKGVERYGRWFLTEFIALISNEFHFSKMRITNLVLVSIPFIGCFFLSYFTSKDGANIVASIAQPVKMEQNNTLYNQMDNETKARDLKLKPYQTAINDLKESKESAIKTALGKDSYKLYQKGNAWVLNEFKPTLDKINKEYNGRILAAAADLEKAKSDFDKLAGAQSQANIQNAERKNEQAKNSFDAVFSILNILGVYPLFIALALLGLGSVQEVVEAINKKPKPQPRTPAEPNQDQHTRKGVASTWEEEPNF